MTGCPSFEILLFIVWCISFLKNKGLIIRYMCKFFVNYLGPMELAKRRFIAEAKLAFKLLAIPLAPGADFYMRLKFAC